MAGRILEITLENFKSYEGVVKIRFDRKFTCVVGPNGAGKSNLVDAVSFVLCVTGGSSRGGGLVGLLHRKETEELDTVTRTTSVSIVYQADGLSTQFRRTIKRRTGAGEQNLPRQDSCEEHLWLNSTQVEQAVYMKDLQRCHILSRARNFLVFQGDIESAAHRQGRDLTAFFEEVSGSIAFRRDYDRLSAEKASKEETMRCRNVVKRNAINEKKRVAQQKSEAENFKRKNDLFQRARIQFYLFRLECAKQLTSKALADQRAEAERNRGLQRTADNKQEELVGAEAECLRSNLTLAAAETAAVQAQNLASDLEPERVSVWNKLNHALQQHTELTSAADRQTIRGQQLKTEVEKLEESLSTIEAKLKSVSEKARQRVLFTAEQQEQFDAAQRAAERDTEVNSQRARELEVQVRVTAGDRAHLEVDIREAQMRHDQLQRRAAALRDDFKRTEARHKQDDDKVAEIIENTKELTNWLRDQDQELEGLIAEKKDIHKEIQEMTITEQQIECENRLKQLDADLQRIIPGVHGRVVNLIKNKLGEDSKKAIHAALNGYINAIVVDSSDVGRQCVQYLKERRLEPMTFLPISSLEVQLDGRLQDVVNHHDGMEMAISRIKYDSEHSRVFDFLLGNVVLADNLENGKQFFFEDLRKLGLSCRVVTLQGETISRDGNISVSVDKSQRTGTPFQFAALDRKKVRLDELSANICKLRSRAAAGRDGEATALEELRVLEAKVQESAELLERQQADLNECQGNQTSAEETLGARKAEFETLMRTEKELLGQRQDLERNISQAVSKHFVELNLAMNVADIRLREREWRQERAEAQRHEDDLLLHKGNVKTELMLLRQSIQEQSKRISASRLPELNAKILELRTQHSNLQERNETLDQRTSGCDERIAADKQANLTCEQSVAKRRKELKAAQAELVESSKKLVQHEASLQTLQERRLDLLRQSVHDGVELPLIPGHLGSGQDAIHELAASGHSPEAAVQAAAIPVHLDELDREKKRVIAQGIEAQKVEEERFRAELKRLAIDLERQRPNLKAIEQLRLANEEVEKLDRDTAEALRELEDVNQRFDGVRTQRCDLFMDCFNQINKEIDSIYKKLTMNTAGLSASTEGGMAFLDLEDLEDPFSAGVNFTAMPPAKRVSELGQLSGGEKAMAALALLFAVHTYQKPPFLMLDEVDANLDANNTHALATFMRSFECQTIVVSLKEQLFTQCEGMVGVTKNRQNQASCAFTFDLESLRVSGAPPTTAGALAAPGTPPELSPGARRVIIPLLDTPLQPPAPQPAGSPSTAAAPLAPASPAYSVTSPASPSAEELRSPGSPSGVASPASPARPPRPAAERHGDESPPNSETECCNTGDVASPVRPNVAAASMESTAALSASPRAAADVSTAAGMESTAAPASPSAAADVDMAAPPGAGAAADVELEAPASPSAGVEPLAPASPSAGVEPLAPSSPSASAARPDLVASPVVAEASASAASATAATTDMDCDSGDLRESEQPVDAGDEGEAAAAASMLPPSSPSLAASGTGAADVAMQVARTREAEVMDVDTEAGGEP